MSSLHCGGVKLIENRIKLLRKEKGWTQEDVAKLVGISRQAVISIEKYKYTPSLELSFQIAEVFELDITDIFIYRKKDE